MKRRNKKNENLNNARADPVYSNQLQDGKRRRKSIPRAWNQIFIRYGRRIPGVPRSRPFRFRPCLSCRVPLRPVHSFIRSARSRLSRSGPSSGILTAAGGGYTRPRWFLSILRPFPFWFIRNMYSCRPFWFIRIQYKLRRVYRGRYEKRFIKWT